MGPELGFDVLVAKEAHIPRKEAPMRSQEPPVERYWREESDVARSR